MPEIPIPPLARKRPPFSPELLREFYLERFRPAGPVPPILAGRNSPMNPVVRPWDLPRTRTAATGFDPAQQLLGPRLQEYWMPASEIRDRFYSQEPTQEPMEKEQIAPQQEYSFGQTRPTPSLESRRARIENLETLRGLADLGAGPGRTMVDAAGARASYMTGLGGSQVRFPPTQPAPDFGLQGRIEREQSGLEIQESQEMDRVPQPLVESLRAKGFDVPDQITFRQLGIAAQPQVAGKRLEAEKAESALDRTSREKIAEEGRAATEAYRDSM